MSAGRYIYIVLLLLGLFAASCSEETDNIYEAVKFEVPAHFPAPVYQFEGNMVTPEKFILGKKLFYDPVLSKDNSISCGSCHQQFVAFAHFDHPLSHGINNQFTLRNSPGLFNLAWNPYFMWDGGVNHIEVQPLAPLNNPVEMDQDLAELIQELNAIPAYKQLFQQAFSSPEITLQRVLLSMAQFMGCMVSADTKYDRYILGKTSLSAEELSGLEVFRQKCGSCHTEPLFTDFLFRNNGLDAQWPNDQGRFMITGEPGDLGKFKTPSLRNIGRTAPYMHDGRFETLEEVLQHYAAPKQSSTLDPLLVSGIPLTPLEKQQILTFLNLLTDDAFIKNPLFSEGK